MVVITYTRNIEMTGRGGRFGWGGTKLFFVLGEGTDFAEVCLLFMPEF